MSVHQIGMYHSRSPNVPRVPTWYREEGLKFPSHPREGELVIDYEKAYLAHLETINVLQSATRKSNEPENQQKTVDLSRCKERVERSQETLEQAETKLRDFIHHSPTERIELLQSEIVVWQKELAEAQQAEARYTEELLHDPDSLRRRLERLAQGYSDAKAEFNQEQLSKLRGLHSVVSSIEYKINCHTRDIYQVHQLEQEGQRQAAAEASIQEVLPRFNDACNKFSEALEELRSVASEHHIHVVTQALRIPFQATFSPGDNTSHGRPPAINIHFEGQ